MMSLSQSLKLTIASIALVALLSAPLLMSGGISAATGAFLYVEVGRFVGPVLGLVILVLVWVSTILIPSKILIRFGDSLTKKEFISLIKRNKRKIIGIVLSGLCVSFIVTLASSFFLMSTLVQSGSKVDAFAAENSNESLQEYVANLTPFLNNNLKSCYNKPESLFKIDERLSASLLDPWIMNVSGVSQADIILYQGWGACEQAAILLQQVMHDSGWETRLAHFKGVDHEWVEMKNGTKWLIVDPWYIGNLVSIQTLRTVKPDFQRAIGVEIQYYNESTWHDDSKNHGYD
jgi:hypothetical protein